VNLSNKRGSTPLLFSLYGPHPSLKLITLLLAHGADPTHVDHDGIGVLHIAAMQGHRELISYFLKEKMVGKAGREKDANGHTPMFYAKMQGFDEIGEMLLEGEGVGVREEKDGEGEVGDRSVEA
jgi:ankyrin repeat protein